MSDLMIICLYADLPNSFMKHCLKTRLKCNLTGHQTALINLNFPDLCLCVNEMQLVSMLNQTWISDWEGAGEMLPGQSWKINLSQVPFSSSLTKGHSALYLGNVGGQLVFTW